jgi:hypothetical protein
MCGIDVQDQLCEYYTLQNTQWWHWVMFYNIDTTIMDSYIMFMIHMIWLNKLAKPMSYLKFNVALARVFIKKKVHVLVQKRRQR